MTEMEEGAARPMQAARDTYAEKSFSSKGEEQGIRRFRDLLYYPDNK